MLLACSKKFDVEFDIFSKKIPTHTIGKGSKKYKLYFDDYDKDVDPNSLETPYGHWLAMIERHRVHEVFDGASNANLWRLNKNNVLFYLTNATIDQKDEFCV